MAYDTSSLLIVRRLNVKVLRSQVGNGWFHCPDSIQITSWCPFKVNPWPHSILMWLPHVVEVEVSDPWRTGEIPGQWTAVDEWRYTISSTPCNAFLCASVYHENTSTNRKLLEVLQTSSYHVIAVLILLMVMIIYLLADG